jgi:signal transduction histidine kinase
VIDNAIKYTDTSGRVTVTLKTAEDQHVAIEVSDTGSGISPVDLPRIFERFYRAADRNARKDAGNGLGLAIVKSIVERHHGSVSVESKLGSGSKFLLKLPLRQPEK